MYINNLNFFKNTKRKMVDDLRDINIFSSAHSLPHIVEMWCPIESFALHIELCYQKKKIQFQV